MALKTLRDPDAILAGGLATGVLNMQKMIAEASA